MTTEIFGIKPHTRNANIYVCKEIIIDEMVIIQGGEGREKLIGTCTLMAPWLVVEYICALSVSSVYIATYSTSVRVASRETPLVHSAHSLCFVTWGTGPQISLGYECAPWYLAPKYVGNRGKIRFWNVWSQKASLWTIFPINRYIKLYVLDLVLTAT